MRMIFFFVLTFLCLYASAEGVAPAYYSANCIDCHKQIVSGEPNLLYNRLGTQIKTLSLLTARVDYCQNALQLHWEKEQIDVVTDYLNQRFYQFK